MAAQLITPLLMLPQNDKKQHTFWAWNNEWCNQVQETKKWMLWPDGQENQDGNSSSSHITKKSGRLTRGLAFSKKQNDADESMNAPIFHTTVV